MLRHSTHTHGPVLNAIRESILDVASLSTRVAEGSGARIYVYVAPSKEFMIITT